ncbi:hypothetical protein SUGI_0961430 [Cryptomeria japonica]|nr:hypothetical protein SUGI_0961430 [Cryptomeria japonica]
MHVVKTWAWQILKGLNYLHGRSPRIIHRDLNYSNIFVEGNFGILKIGDLGLSCVLGQDGFAYNIVGTPEFMGPELYEENCDELVHTYSFGISMLEIITIEIPYSEYNSVAQVYKKVDFGRMPTTLEKVLDPQVNS